MRSAEVDDPHYTHTHTRVHACMGKSGVRVGWTEHMVRLTQRRVVLLHKVSTFSTVHRGYHLSDDIPQSFYGGLDLGSRVAGYLCSQSLTHLYQRQSISLGNNTTEILNFSITLSSTQHCSQKRRSR